MPAPDPVHGGRGGRRGGRLAARRRRVVITTPAHRISPSAESVTCRRAVRKQSDIFRPLAGAGIPTPACIIVGPGRPGAKSRPRTVATVGTHAPAYKINQGVNAHTPGLWAFAPARRRNRSDPQFKTVGRRLFAPKVQASQRTLFKTFSYCSNLHCQMLPKSPFGWMPCKGKPLCRDNIERLRLETNVRDEGPQARIRSWLKEIPDAEDQDLEDSESVSKCEIDQTVSVVSQATTCRHYCSSEGSDSPQISTCFSFLHERNFFKFKTSKAKSTQHSDGHQGLEIISDPYRA